MVKSRPSVMLNSEKLEDGPKKLRISFENVKNKNDRKKVVFDIDLNNYIFSVINLLDSIG